ncbi:MAG: pyruvate formate-lyase-activating protein [Candidatus Omnitrophota bacterium]
MKACKVHSLESFSTLDGPGIRYVVFLQGCLGRCIYCQNPDTWKLDAGELYSASEIFKKIESCVPYFASSNGGVTLSGGEPLLQPDFIIELFKMCKSRSIHTTIDTSAFCAKDLSGKKLERIIDLTDLFMVDLKAPNKKLHKKLTGRDLGEALKFISILEDKKKPYWIRYVLVPGVNDSKDALIELKRLVASLKSCSKFEFLPYHTLGNHKWKHLGLKYKLKNTKSATPKDIETVSKLIGTVGQVPY